MQTSKTRFSIYSSTESHWILRSPLVVTTKSRFSLLRVLVSGLQPAVLHWAFALCSSLKVWLLEASWGQRCILVRTQTLTPKSDNVCISSYKETVWERMHFDDIFGQNSSILNADSFLVWLFKRGKKDKKFGGQELQCKRIKRDFQFRAQLNRTEFCALHW